MPFRALQIVHRDLEPKHLGWGPSGLALIDFSSAASLLIQSPARQATSYSKQVGVARAATQGRLHTRWKHSAPGHAAGMHAHKCVCARTVGAALHMNSKPLPHP